MAASSPTTSTPTAPASPSRLTARDLALVAAMAGLVAVLGVPGAFYAFGQAAPITLQSMGVMLVGALLGWKRGGLAILLFLALAAIGLPVLAGGRGGLAVFVGPTSGYLLGYLLGAMTTGALVQMRARRLNHAWLAVAILVGGIGVVHLFGVPGMALRAGLPWDKALMAGLAFVPGDLIKAVLATVVAAGVHRAIPTLLPSTWAGRQR